MTASDNDKTNLLSKYQCSPDTVTKSTYNEVFSYCSLHFTNNTLLQCSSTPISLDAFLLIF